MKISTALSTTTNTLTLKHEPIMAEYIFAACVASPGIYIALFSTTDNSATLLWRILSVAVFVYLSIQFIPSSSFVNISNQAPILVTFSSYTHPFARPFIYQPSTIDHALLYLQLQYANPKNKYPKRSGIQLFFVFKHHEPIPTSHTAVLGSKLIHSLRAAALEISEFLNVELIDETIETELHLNSAKHLYPRRPIISDDD